MDWPSNSPDINAIENLWAILKGRMASFPRTTPQEWKDKLIEEWESLDHKLLSNLVNSMKDRIQACILANGGYTRY
jgi:hypothetical protein